MWSSPFLVDEIALKNKRTKKKEEMNVWGGEEKNYAKSEGKEEEIEVREIRNSKWQSREIPRWNESGKDMENGEEVFVLRKKKDIEVMRNSEGI